MLGVPKGTSPSGVRGSVAAPGPSRQPRTCPALEPGDLGGGLRALGEGWWLSTGSEWKQSSEGGWSSVPGAAPSCAFKGENSRAFIRASDE